MGEGASGYKRALGRWGFAGRGRARATTDAPPVAVERCRLGFAGGVGRARAFIGFAIWYATVRAVAYWQ
ncbi:MAG: hypothetical protein RL077_288 [Verrucomicrobiota bacterium]